MPCAYHSDRESVDTCSDCGKQLCKFCKVTTNAKTRCPDCIEKTYTLPNVITAKTKETITSKPAYTHPTYRIHWNWVLLILFVAVGSIFILYTYHRSVETISTMLGSGNQRSNLTSLAPLPTSEWVGLDGETEYEYVSCGADCYYVGADGYPIELVNNPDAKNPTWKELKDFLLLDNTDSYSYVEGSFTCGDFAEVVHNNAEKAGIRTAWVAIDFSSGGIGHANNAFNTTDQGLVYIDDTGIQDTAQIKNSACHRDRIAAVSTGTEYIPETLFSCPWYSEWASMGKVTHVSIQW
jgi:hypothetical protein